MTKHRICKKCNAKEDEGVAFPEHEMLCRKCRAEHSAQYYQENREDILARHVQYYEDHKEYIAKRHAQYYEDHKEHINIQDRQQYHDHVASQRVARPCSDCGKPIPKRAQKYCAECKQKHHRLAAKLGMQNLREQKKVNEKKS